jgi:hypothetical protein
LQWCYYNIINKTIFATVKNQPATSNQPSPRLRLAKPATNLRQGYGWQSQQPTFAKATVGKASNN